MIKTKKTVDLISINRTNLKLKEQLRFLLMNNGKHFKRLSRWPFFRTVYNKLHNPDKTESKDH